MLIIKNLDKTRTLTPEGDESEILDYIDKTLGSTFILNEILKLVNQRRAQRNYDEVVELHNNLKDLSSNDRQIIIIDTIHTIALMDKSNE